MHRDYYIDHCTDQAPLLSSRRSWMLCLAALNSIDRYGVGQHMKLLVPVVYYARTGRREEMRRRCLFRIIGEYLSMPFDIDLVVFSNAKVSLPRGIELKQVYLAGNPLGLPYQTRPMIRERYREYDLILYTEDDILITERHIRSFLEVSEVLNENEVAGFMRYELHGGEVFYPDTAFRGWKKSSARVIGNRVFTEYANVHQGCFLLTREQMQLVISSGGFRDEPHTSDCYGILECCASDVYLTCGMKKVICISNFTDFRIEHMAPQDFSRFLISDVHMQLEIEEVLSSL